MGKCYHLEGQRFGRLVVLRKGKSIKTSFGTRVYWLCQCDCGNTKEVQTQKLMSKSIQDGRLPHTRSCGCIRREQMRASVGELNHSWKGGRIIGEGGYVLVRTPPDLSGLGKSTGYIPEHRLIMIRHLGRALLPTETVHHKNEVKSDNRIENLELWSRSHSDGAKVSDKIQWSTEFLSVYAPERLRKEHIQKALQLL